MGPIPTYYVTMFILIYDCPTGFYDFNATYLKSICRSQIII